MGTICAPVGLNARLASVSAMEICRGCDRGPDEVRLEVHHRVYGVSGSCGHCYLTAVDDEDLTTLCVDCHDVITDVRRRIRYGKRNHEVVVLPEPAAPQLVIKVKAEITVEF